MYRVRQFDYSLPNVWPPVKQPCDETPLIRVKLLPSGRRFRSAKRNTSRFRDSFFPAAIRTLNYCEEYCRYPPWNIVCYIFVLGESLFIKFLVCVMEMMAYYGFFVFK